MITNSILDDFFNSPLLAKIKYEEINTTTDSFKKTKMTQDQYNRAGLILEQIKTAKRIKEQIKIDYNKYKDTDEHLKETLNKCNEVVSVLIEIQNKLKYVDRK